MEMTVYAYLGLHPVISMTKGYLTHCPLHDDRRPSFMVFADGNWRCYTCNVFGTPIALLRRTHFGDISSPTEAYRKARALITEMGLTAKTTPVIVSRQELDDTDKALVLEVASYYARTGQKQASAYCAERGVLAKQCRTFRIGYCTGNGRRDLLSLGPEQQLIRLGLLTRTERGTLVESFFGRITISNHDGSFFQGRSLTNHWAKYKNLKAPKSLFVAGAARQSDPVIVVEGVYDALAVEQAGFRGIAVGGTSLRSDLVRLLVRTPALVCFDGDAPGLTQATALVERFRRAGGVSHLITLPAGNDPADFMREHKIANLRERILNEFDRNSTYQISPP